MNLDFGTVLVGVAIFIFYFRFLQLKGRKKKAIRKEEAQKLSSKQAEKAKKASKYGAKIKQPEPQGDTSFRVISWWIFGTGFLITCLGVMMRTSLIIPPPYNAYWWAPTTLGILILTLSFR